MLMAILHAVTVGRFIGQFDAAAGRIALVLMVMRFGVPVGCCERSAVGAILRHRSPGELERQQKHEQNCYDAAHWPSI